RKASAPWQATGIPRSRSPPSPHRVRARPVLHLEEPAAASRTLDCSIFRLVARVAPPPASATGARPHAPFRVLLTLSALGDVTGDLRKPIALRQTSAV